MQAEYKEQVKNIEACAINQQYIIDSSRLFFT